MRTRIKEVMGVDWFDGAIMNCTWEGPRLSDVLTKGAGVHQISESDKRKQKHVQFASYGTETQDDTWYGGSIPFERAMDPEMDVILAVKVSHTQLLSYSPTSSTRTTPLFAFLPGTDICGHR